MQTIHEVAADRLMRAAMKLLHHVEGEGMNPRDLDGEVRLKIRGGELAEVAFSDAAGNPIGGIALPTEPPPAGELIAGLVLNAEVKPASEDEIDAATRHLEALASGAKPNHWRSRDVKGTSDLPLLDKEGQLVEDEGEPPDADAPTVGDNGI